MRETTVVSLGGVEVFALVVEHIQGIRLRVASAEWQTLDFSEGQTHSVRWRFGEARSLMISSIVSMTDTGQTWVQLLQPVGEVGHINEKGKRSSLREFAKEA